MSDWLRLDDLRESWIFVLLGVGESTHQTNPSSSEKDTRIEYWEVGVGNSQSLVETNCERIDSSGINSEIELLDCLMTELDSYRYQDSVLIFPDRESITRLRRKLVTTNVEKHPSLVTTDVEKQPSLRGFRLIVFQEELSQYLDQQLQDYDFGRQSRSPPRHTETDTKEVVSGGSSRAFWELWLQVFRLLPASVLKGEPL